MGNVPMKLVVGESEEKGLTVFQRRKLTYDFYTFFDLNKDGHLSYQDFQWAKDKICYMSGWQMDTPKYKSAEKLFSDIWESLSFIADLDHDGKITRDEWIVMWNTYKQEIVDKEGLHADFLRKFVRHAMRKDDKDANTDTDTSDDEHTSSEEQSIESTPEELAVELDSDEEPISLILPHREMAVDVEFSSNENNRDNVEKAERKKHKKKRDSEDLRKRDKSRSTSRSESRSSSRSSSSRSSSSRVSSTSSEESLETKEMLEECKLPKWLYKYLTFRFDLLDRAGDGVIDHEEFEYVLSEFGINERCARQAFTIVTENDSVVLDFPYFVELFEAYYLSDDPSALGNFINGKLTFDEDLDFDEEENEPKKKKKNEDKEKEESSDTDSESGVSLCSMDDDLREEMEERKRNADKTEKENNELRLNMEEEEVEESPKGFRLHERSKQLFNEVKHKCCLI